ncbi:hypothetical protein FLAV_00366 [Flavobacteriales bacterium]|nr:hypothetical protein FLAV_00366 [Flavobacteriales bacterium]
MATNKKQHLDCVLKSHNIENNETLITNYRAKRDEVKNDLLEKYKGKIYSPFNSGSYKKKTAVNIKFDIDLVIPFKKNGADTLETIFTEIFNYFDQDYRKKDSTLIGVNKQKVSIGLEFMVDGQILYLDIVPGREVNDYEKDGDLNLYVNDTMGLIQKASCIKSNIQKQIEKIRDNSEARDGIKLLKVWKRRNNINVKSFFLELISIKAIEDHKGTVPNDNWNKLKYILEFIRDNVETVSLVDPGNSNNVVSDALEDFEKKNISENIKWMLQDIENNDSSIERHFPKNTEFPCEESNDKYIVSPNRKPEKLNNNDFG